jgi:hypothetical protein
MSRWLGRISRFLFGGTFVTALFFGISTLASKASWDNYWNTTIYRVQTIDFNMLSHTLPTKLSYLLLVNDKTEIQRTLNSNYGIFGIVVTDCKIIDKDCNEQKIVYASDSKRSWKKQLTTQSLSDQPYNLLQNPPPLITQGGYDNYRNSIWNKGEYLSDNTSKIIGRVYYIRGVQPTFEEDYQSWLKDIGSSNGNHPYYLLSAITFLSCGMLFWIITYLIIEYLIRKSAIEKELFNTQIHQFRQQLKSRLTQNQKLISEREDLYKKISVYKDDLECYQKNQQTQEESLQIEVVDLKAVEHEKKLELDSKIDDLESLKEELSWIYKNIDPRIDLEVNIQTKQQEITNLNLEIQTRDRDLNILTNSLKEKESQLVIVRQLNYQAIQEIKSLKSKLIELSTEKDEANTKVLQLEKQLSNNSVDELLVALESAKMENESLKAYERDGLRFLARAEKSSRDLTRERDNLQQTLDEKSIQTNQLVSDRNILKYKIIELEQEITGLKSQITIYGQYSTATSQIQENKKLINLINRPRDMSNIEFARNARIQIKMFPNNTKEEAQKFYDTKNNGYDPKPVNQIAIVEFLRHHYTNYDLLCREFSRYDEKARDILKIRANAEVYANLNLYV